MVLLLYCDVVYPLPEALVANIWSRLGLYTALYVVASCRALCWVSLEVN